jgi:hypothetical protein
MSIKPRITTANRNNGYRVEMQIHSGEIGLTEVSDADTEQSVVAGLDGGGDMDVSLPDLIDLLTRLVEASAFQPGQRVTWKGVRSGAPRFGFVHATEDGGFFGPTVTIRTDKGGYTKVQAVYLTRV